MLRHWTARLRAFLTAGQHDEELASELESHAAMLAEDLIRRGLPPAQAHRTARLQLGGITQLKEAHRETRGLPFMDTLLQDLRYTVRTLNRERSFAAFAILIAGLGIAASATVFSLLNTVILRPLPFKDPARLVWIQNQGKDRDLSGQTVPVNPYLDLRSHSQSLSDVAAYYAFYVSGDKKMTGEGKPERLTGVPITQNFFDVLGVQPRMGRSFTPEEARKNQAVVVLSAGFWSRRFASDPGIIGRKLILNDRPTTVIGVMPPSFDFGSIFAPGARVDLFLPLPLIPEVNRMGNTLSMVGRLAPGATAQQAHAEAGSLSEPLRIKHNRDELRFHVSSLEQHVRGNVKPALFVLAGAVGVVMLIVCANLANLHLARMVARQKEIGIRLALGAGRGRLVRQMLTESIVLSSVAAVFGVALAVAATQFLASLEGISLPLRENVQVDGTTLAFTALIAVAAGLLFGMAPAFRVSAGALNGALKETNRGSTEGKTHNWVRSALVVSEIAFACVLLVGSGLLLRSFLHVLDTDLGFRPDKAAALRVDPGPQYSTQQKRTPYFDEMLRRVRSIPGVESAGLTDVLPLGSNRSWNAGAEGQTYSDQHPAPSTFVRIVSDGYLKSMGIPLLAGRDLTERDNAASKPVILINQSLARILWPGQDPIGKAVTYTDRDLREVVGVVADVRHLALEQGSGYEMYIPIRQNFDYSSVDLVVRTGLPPSTIATAIRGALQPIDPTLAANEFRTLQSIVDKSVSPRRFIVLLLGGFSIFALILASLGIYAVVSYLVTQRTQEIGIRMALGATSGNVQAQVLSRTLTLAFLGIGLGVAASYLLTGSLINLLYEVTATDPLTFVGALATLVVVAAAAGYFPARRASRINPMVALRSN